MIYVFCIICLTNDFNIYYTVYFTANFERKSILLSLLFVLLERVGFEENGPI